MSKTMMVGAAVVVTLLFLVAVGLVFAQQGGQGPQGGQSSAGAPTAPMGGPASGPPGMALPKDVVKGEKPSVPNPAKTSRIVWIIAGLVVLGAIVAFLMTRKKSA
mgnify:CR=1 FL=1